MPYCFYIFATRNKCLYLPKQTNKYAIPQLINNGNELIRSSTKGLNIQPADAISLNHRKFNKKPIL